MISPGYFEAIWRKEGEFLEDLFSPAKEFLYYMCYDVPTNIMKQKLKTYQNLLLSTQKNRPLKHFFENGFYLEITKIIRLET